VFPIRGGYRHRRCIDVTFHIADLQSPATCHITASTPLPVPGVGRARWLVELIRCRRGESATFKLEACDAKGRLALPAELAHRPASGRAGAHPEGEAHARMRVVGTEEHHYLGISTKPMLTKCLTAFLTTVSDHLVFRHRASRNQADRSRGFRQSLPEPQIRPPSNLRTRPQPLSDPPSTSPPGRILCDSPARPDVQCSIGKSIPPRLSMIRPRRHRPACRPHRPSRVRVVNPWLTKLATRAARKPQAVRSVRAVPSRSEVAGMARARSAVRCIIKCR
jgi:hypothetical protein